MAKIRVFLTDDHTLFRQGIKTLVASEPDMEPVGEASNAVDAIGWRADGLFVQLATYLTVIPL